LPSVIVGQGLIGATAPDANRRVRRGRTLLRGL